MFSKSIRTCTDLLNKMCFGKNSHDTLDCCLKNESGEGFVLKELKLNFGGFSNTQTQYPTYHIQANCSLNLFTREVDRIVELQQNCHLVRGRLNNVRFLRETGVQLSTAVV